MWWRKQRRMVSEAADGTAGGATGGENNFGKVYIYYHDGLLLQQKAK